MLLLKQREGAKNFMVVPAIRIASGPAGESREQKEKKIEKVRIKNDIQLVRFNP